MVLPWQSLKLNFFVFPKYSGEGAIGGSDSIDERFEMQRLQQDTENILGDDIYKALEQRKLKRRMIWLPPYVIRALMLRRLRFRVISRN